MNLDENQETFDSIGEKCDISIDEERAVWLKFYLNNFIYVPAICL